MSLDNHSCLSSISSKFAVVIANAIGYSFSCKSYTRRSHGWVGRIFQNVIFSKFHPKNQGYCSLTPNDQKHGMCLRNTLPSFQYSVETCLKLICSNHHLKIMHFSVTNNVLHFPTNGHTRDHPVCDLHLNL